MRTASMVQRNLSFDVEATFQLPNLTVWLLGLCYFVQPRGLRAVLGSIQYSPHR